MFEIQCLREIPVMTDVRTIVDRVHTTMRPGASEELAAALVP